MQRTHYQGRRLADVAGLMAYLPRLLLYPLQADALLTGLLLAGMIWIGLQSLLGIAMLGVAVLWAVAYLERVMEASADGEADAPVFGGGQIMLANAASLRMLIGPLAVVSLWFSLRDEHAAAAQSLIAVAGFLMPAHLLLGNQFGLLASFNPLRLLALIWLTGRAYLLACGLLAVGVVFLLQVRGGLSLFGLLLMLLYLLVLVSHLLGFVAFRHAEELGLPVRVSRSTAAEQAILSQEARLEDTVAAVRQAYVAKNLEAQLAALNVPDSQLADPLHFAEQLFSHLHGRVHKQVWLTQGTRLIQRLLRRGLLPRAVEVYQDCLDSSPHIQRLLPAPDRQRLARHTADRRLDGLFERLTLDGLEHAQSPHELLDWALLSLPYLLDVRNDEAAARAVFDYLPDALPPALEQRLGVFRRILFPAGSDA